MNIRKNWQVVTAAGLVLAALWAGPAQADFVFGAPVNLGPNINSYEREYDPTISADGLELYFQSYRAGGYGASDLYVAKRATVQDAWEDVQNLGPVVNTGAAESGPSLSSDGLTLYFNSDRSGGMGGHDLYVTTRAGRSDAWGEPVNLGPVVNSEYGEINPNISSDGLTLFFADVEGDSTAPRPGGLGNPDVWVTTRASLSDPWGPPVNLGAPVNSAWTDASPDVSADGLLLFFNFYRGDQAFFDICVAVRGTAQGPWSIPMNLGAPVNGTSWDGNADLSADGRELYFVSDRGGGQGATDVWMVALSPIVDFNGDGKVDEEEVRIITASLGADDPLCDIGPTPFGDGVVDMKDMAVLTQYASGNVADPTLVACWAFDETEGAVACDSTGTCNGVLVGNPVWQPGAGAVGGALQLDGFDDYVVAPYSKDPAVGSWSVFAWVRGGKPGQTILSQKGGANWLTTDAAGYLMTDLRSPGRLTWTLCSQATVTDGNWHRIGMVWDGATRSLYVDGELVARDTQDGLKSAYGNLQIGAARDLAPGAFWSGLIDDVRIYSRIVKP